MTDKPWADLPSAPWVDRILADAKARPEVWGAAWDATRGSAWDAAWHATRDAARVAARDAAWEATRGAVWIAARNAALVAARDAAWEATRGAAWDAFRALIAWPESTYMLDQDPEVLEMTLRLAQGERKHQAVLLYPACAALHSKERL